MMVKFAVKKGVEHLLIDLRKRFPPSRNLAAFVVLQPGFWYRNQAMAEDGDSMAEFIMACKKKFEVLLGKFGATGMKVHGEQMLSEMPWRW